MSIYLSAPRKSGVFGVKDGSTLGGECLPVTLIPTELQFWSSIDVPQRNGMTSVSGRFCCKSRLQRIWPLGLSLRAALGSAGLDAFYATSTLRDEQSLSGWSSRDQRCKPPQVLGDGG